LEALHVSTDFPAEVTLHEKSFLYNGLGDFIQLLLVEVIGPDVRIQAGVLDKTVG
jgi:hypothetical protein